MPAAGRVAAFLAVEWPRWIASGARAGAALVRLYGGGVRVVRIDARLVERDLPAALRVLGGHVGDRARGKRGPRRRRRHRPRLLPPNRHRQPIQNIPQPRDLRRDLPPITRLHLVPQRSHVADDPGTVERLA